MSEPIKVFKNFKQAETCLKEWQDRLFLDDWIIDIELDQDLDGQDGTIEYNYVNEANVKIGKPRVKRYCAELILIHELLHLRYGLFRKESETYEENFVEMYEHMKMEQLAKSLLMAKYNLKFSWFKNY